MGGPQPDEKPGEPAEAVATVTQSEGGGAWESGDEAEDKETYAEKVEEAPEPVEEGWSGELREMARQDPFIKDEIPADADDCCPWGRGRCYGADNLHAGSLYLYVKGGAFRAIADIDHVFRFCRRGLVEGLRFMLRLFRRLEAMGLEPVAVGKAFDDTLYAYVRSRRTDGWVEFEGMRVAVWSMESSVEEFEKRHHYMERVGEDVLAEALGDGRATL